MHKKISVSLVAVLAVVFIAQAPGAEALSCLQPEPTTDFIARGGVIFNGTVTANDRIAISDNGAETRNVTFVVDRVWGSAHISNPLTVRDDIPAGSDFNDIWGFRATFEEGTQYNVYATFDGGRYVADIGGCAQSSNGYRDMSAELGQGYVPDGSTGNPTPPRGTFQDDLRKQIQELLALVANLQQQLANLGGESVVTDFESCVAVTGIAMESYPRQCNYKGRMYVENITVIPSRPPSVVCPVLTRNLRSGVRGNDVALLQGFLRDAGVYTYPEITGYYGPATQSAVERWQALHGVVSFGAPDITGFGVVGPDTRSAIQRTCGGNTPIAIPPIPPTAPPVMCTLEYAPVCGQQGGERITYGNSCMLSAAGSSFLYSGECR
jgi:hypothetical protein